MKTRALVWTVVAIAVLIVVIVLIATGRRAPGPSLDGVHRQVEVVSSRLDDLERRVADSREQLVGQDPAPLAAVEQQIAEARAALAEVPQLDKTDAAMAKLGVARNAYSSALRQYRRLTRPPRR